MCQEGSQETNKIKILHFKLDIDILGFPKWIFASIIQSSYNFEMCQ